MAMLWSLGLTCSHAGVGLMAGSDE
jgi:hypothetical protein